MSNGHVAVESDDNQEQHEGEIETLCHCGDDVASNACAKVVPVAVEKCVYESYQHTFTLTT